MGMESITLSKEQQRRLEIIHRVQSGRMSKQEAADVLKVTRRQVDNIVRRFNQEGAVSVVHGNTGKAPVFKTPPETVQRILSLAGEGGQYADFSVCHLQEMLGAYEGIQVRRSTLDRLLKQHRVRPPGHAAPAVKRRQRTRSAAEGLLVQIDASLHAWLEGRGPKLALLGAIDDATSRVLHLRFHPSECQAGYLTLFRAVAVSHGLPQAYYHDRHTILHSPKKATLQDELDGIVPQSELQRLLGELGIASIAARSPQAKGRIERLWQTLQDRLVKEMRLAGISTLEEANAFLPGFIERFNARFIREATDPETAWIAIEPGMDLAYYFSTRQTRVVRPDHTISWYGSPLQVLRNAHERSLTRQRITVHTTPEGELYLYAGKERLRYQVLPVAPAKPTPPAPAPAAAKAPGEPHPRATARQRAWLFASV